MGVPRQPRGVASVVLADLRGRVSSKCRAQLGDVLGVLSLNGQGWSTPWKHLLDLDLHGRIHDGADEIADTARPSMKLLSGQGAAAAGPPAWAWVWYGAAGDGPPALAGSGRRRTESRVRTEVRRKVPISTFPGWA